MDLPKLHLGCGKRYLAGYIHIDLSDAQHIDYRCNVSKLSMFADESVGLIYASHVLEYFDRLEVSDVLKEWRRILVPKGLLRLSVPNFSALAEIYLENNDLEQILGPIFGRWKIWGVDKLTYHKTAYDRVTLDKLLAEIGYIDVTEWDWRKVFVGELEGFDDYSKAYIPHMDFDSGKPISLNVEAIKSALY